MREAPFYHYKPLDTYVVTRYRDIMAISPRVEVFSNARGIFLNEIKYREVAGADTTRALLLGLPYYFAKNPDQWSRGSAFI